MMRLRIVGVACMLSALLLTPVNVSAADASPSPTLSPTTSPAGPSADTDVATRAKEWLHRLQTGNIDRSQLDTAMNSAMTPDVIKQIADKFGPLGDPQAFTPLGSQSVGGGGATAYVYRVAFKSATLNEVFVVDKDGKIGGIQFPPAQ
jgi:hypothetical protein